MQKKMICVSEGKKKNEMNENWCFYYGWLTTISILFYSYAFVRSSVNFVSFVNCVILRLSVDR